MTNLKLFSQYFIGEIATNDKQRDESRALRWQVYCEERDFEAKQEHTNQIEADTYDWHSLHFNIRCRATREVVASVRLVMSHPYEPKRPLPAERYADAAFLACGHRYQRHQIAEISRFAVSKKKIPFST